MHLWVAGKCSGREITLLFSAHSFYTQSFAWKKTARIASHAVVFIKRDIVVFPEYDIQQPQIFQTLQIKAVNLNQPNCVETNHSFNTTSNSKITLQTPRSEGISRSYIIHSSEIPTHACVSTCLNCQSKLETGL